MKKKLIITAVTLIHLGLILIIARSCWETPADKQTAPGSSPDTPSASAASSSTSSTASSVGATSSAAAKKTEEVTLQSIPFTYLPRKLSPEVTARQTSCRTGVLIDWGKKKILWRQSADKPVPIASMTKMMTALLLMDAIKADPNLSLKTPVRVTKAASLVGGSQVYLDPRETFSIDELLKCMMIFSANDAAYQIAEYLGKGDVSPFIAKMNSRAKELGLIHAKFYTPHGLNDPGTGKANQATAMELAFLGAELIHQPAVVKWSSTRLSYIREDNPKFQRFQLVNRNKLISSCPGVNGMKTGFTKQAGFCVTATCERGGRVLIAVVTGCASSNGRNDLVKALFDWGYRQ